MAENDGISKRKADHIEISLQEDIASSVNPGFDQYRLKNKALPEINLSDVDLISEVFGRKLRAPILISSMTGGTERAAALNELLATAAQEFGIAIGSGSQRVAIENPDLAAGFNLRKYAPDALIFANLGAVQLNLGYGLAECEKAIEIAGADALYLHLNPLQEALQPRGDTQFGNLLPKIEAICHQLSVPVVVKEVGWGIDAETARRLADVGVRAIDVAGAGGTSWSQVEMYRETDPIMRAVAADFVHWGIPTAQCLQELRSAGISLPIIASGGLRNGMDLAKSLALGASLGGFASPLLKAASKGYDQLKAALTIIQNELQICMFACGIQNIHGLTLAALEFLGDEPHLQKS